MDVRSDGHPDGCPFDRMVIRPVELCELVFQPSFRALSVAFNRVASKRCVEITT
ncbi:hypothetical protein Hanom_Chr00s002752g01704491 [Helianthus anomalus]